MEKKKNGWKILIIIISIIAVLELPCYLLYKEYVDKKDSETEVIKDEETKIKTLDITSKEITKLVYPAYNFDINGGDYLYRPLWLYEDVTLSEFSRDDLMLSASYIASDKFIEGDVDEYETDVLLVPATDIKAAFIKVFGPDTTYTDGNLTTNVCGKISDYSAEDGLYIAYTGCGGDSNAYWNNLTKLYKAEQDGDYIYTYWYVQPYLTTSPVNETQGYYYFFDRYIDLETFEYDSNDELIINGYKDKSTTEEEMNSKFSELTTNDEASSYKFTFKKQSDGNYYFYSGEWQ